METPPSLLQSISQPTFRVTATSLILSLELFSRTKVHPRHPVWTMSYYLSFLCFLARAEIVHRLFGSIARCAVGHPCVFYDNIHIRVKKNLVDWRSDGLHNMVETPLPEFIFHEQRWRSLI
ncbi:hypothetical protein PMIN06_003035 [Paraphaeosphaeria minitans]